MMLNYELYFNDKKAYYFKTKYIDDEKLAEEISVGIANLFKSLIPEKEIDYTFASVKDNSCYLFVSENIAFEIRDFLLVNKVLEDFNGVLDTFIIVNLTVDFVLENIIENGIDSII